MIAIVDYGVGNLFSLQSSLRYLDVDTVVTGEKTLIEKADHIILPGVGAFGDAVQKLEETGLIPLLQEQGRGGKPILGICLGMQLLFDRGLEYGEHEGLGLIHGEVTSLEEALEESWHLKVPHIGWNQLVCRQPRHPLFKYHKNEAYVYYVHSYYATNCEEAVLASSEYGVEIPGVVANGSIYGMQFHPEKSGKAGLGLLQAFCEL